MYGLLAHLLRTDCVRLIQNLIARKYLAEDTVVNRNNIFASSSYIRLGERAEDILIHNQLFKFSVSKQKKSIANSTTAKTRKRAVKSVIENMTGVNEMVNSFKNTYSNLDDSMADFIVPDDFIDDDLYENKYKNATSAKPTSSKVTRTAKSKNFSTFKTKKTAVTRNYGKVGKTKQKTQTTSTSTNQSRYFERKTGKTISKFVVDDDDYITIPD